MINPRFMEAVAFLYPQADLSPRSSDVRVENHGDGNGPIVALWNTAVLGSQPTDAAIAAALVQLDQARATESTRMASLTGDAQVQAWIDRLAISSNAQIDTYFAANVTTLAQNIAVTKALAKIIAAKLRLR